MPLFEFFRVPKGKLDPVQEKPGNYFDESSSRNEDELIELGWENGQLLKQIHGSTSSSRASKPQPLNLNNVDSDHQVTKIKNPDNSKDFHPSAELGTSRNDYLVPWLSNFPMQSDYNSYFSSESVDVNLGQQEKAGFEANHDPLLSSNNSFTASATSNYQLYPPLPMPFQSLSAFSSLRSQAIDSDSITSELPSSDKNDNMGSANVDCFSRPFALMSSSIDKADGSGFSGVDGSRDKAALDVPNIKFGLSRSKVKPTEIIIGSSSSTLRSGPDKTAVTKVVDGEKKSGSSSVCSGGSDEPQNNMKRKSHEDESSSEDAEDESVSMKKRAPNQGTKGKRIRSAEVHNLSERKRRDRINEKMRALQELIPNCNKVDKASMLDEAIEYLKSLQLQLQIMTMGSGMYMSPMMLPTAMQHMVPPMAHFPTNMGIGIGTFARPSMAMPNLQFYGLPGQGFPLAMSRPSFIPLAACQGPEVNVRRSCQVTDSMKQSKNQSAEAQDISGRGISNSQKKHGRTYPNITTRR